jgi:hypothetical protein
LNVIFQPKLPIDFLSKKFIVFWSKERTELDPMTSARAHIDTNTMLYHTFVISIVVV